MGPLRCIRALAVGRPGEAGDPGCVKHRYIHAGVLGITLTRDELEGVLEDGPIRAASVPLVEEMVPIARVDNLRLRPVTRGEVCDYSLSYPQAPAFSASVAQTPEGREGSMSMR